MSCLDNTTPPIVVCHGAPWPFRTTTNLSFARRYPADVICASITQGDSISEIGGVTNRRNWALVMRFGMDIVFYLVLAVGPLALAFIPISRLSGYDGGWDVPVPVVVGERSILPFLPVEVAPGVSPAHKYFRIYKAQGQLRFLSTSFAFHLAVSLVQYLASRWMLARIEVTTVPFSPLIRISEEWIICGSLALVLASIWKDAARMAEEQSLTV